MANNLISVQLALLGSIIIIFTRIFISSCVCFFFPPITFKKKSITPRRKKKREKIVFFFRQYFSPFTITNKMWCNFGPSVVSPNWWDSLHFSYLEKRSSARRDHLDISQQALHSAQLGLAAPCFPFQRLQPKVSKSDDFGHRLSNLNKKNKLKHEIKHKFKHRKSWWWALFYPRPVGRSLLLHPSWDRAPSYSSSPHLPFSNLAQGHSSQPG